MITLFFLSFFRFFKLTYENYNNTFIPALVAFTHLKVMRALRKRMKVMFARTFALLDLLARLKLGFYFQNKKAAIISALA